MDPAYFAEHTSKSKFPEEKTKNALGMMKEAGFEIVGLVEVVVDEQLPFMGYTTRKWKEHVIVVSGMAVDSGLVEGLLIHEMSHVYRTEKNHPSHDYRLLNDFTRRLSSKYRFSAKYQVEILQQIINHVQDLYADDITFEVFRKNQARLPFPLERMSDFFLSWIKREPSRLGNKTKERWVNASILLSNAFAISNLERHHVEDVGARMKTANEMFLSKLDEPFREEFSYFRTLMTNLKEDVKEQEFKDGLLAYVDRFLQLTS